MKTNNNYYENDKKCYSCMQTDQQRRYNEISGLKEDLLGRNVQPYLEEFGGSVQQEQLMVGKMSIEQVEVGLAAT